MKAFTKGKRRYTLTTRDFNRGTYAAKDDANSKSLETTKVITRIK